MLERMKKIKLFVLDMDGTIYLDSTPLEGAIDFCKKLEERGKLVYFTNNASKNPEDYVKKLTEKYCHLGRCDSRLSEHLS